MKFEIIDGMFNIGTDAVGGLAIALLMLMIGYALRKRVGLFQKFCLPAAVIGGLIIAILNFALYMGGIGSISLDTTFQSPAMICFFTCIGYTADLKTIKKGGVLLIVYWIFCAVLCVCQSVLPLILSSVTGLDPVYAILAGTTTMMGGHGNGGSFGLTAEEMGYAAGQAVGLACATFGLISGSLSGGPFARRLIEKKGLKPSEEDFEFIAEKEAAMAASAAKTGDPLQAILKLMTILALTMTIGSLCAGWISKFMGDVVLPGYIGGMFMGVIMRNVNEKLHLFELDMALMDRVSDIMLSVFLALAMSSMKLWQLIDLAIPLLIILACQVVFVLLYCRFIVFPGLTKVGKSGYDAAVMCSGLLGHGLGATPNGIANMTAVVERYGPSRKALFVVPLVASSLIDFVMIPTIVIAFNYACNMVG